MQPMSLGVVSFDMLESFWVSLQVLIVKSLSEKLRNVPLIPRARKLHVFALKTMYFSQNHYDIITKSCLSLLKTMLAFLREKYIYIAMLSA